MSNVIEQGLEKVRDTHFIFNERGGFEIRNAYIFWTNFRGERDQFGNDARNFNVAVPEEVGVELLKRGWRVRERASYDDESRVLYFINIKVRMESKNPPIISLYSEFRGKRTKRALDINTIGELDRLDLMQCDLSVNAYESPMYPGKITGYLGKLNAIQTPNIEFGGKYDDWLDEEHDCLADGSCTLEEWTEMNKKDE